MRIAISLFVVFAVTALVTTRTNFFSISPRYERAKKTPWQLLDSGEDPTEVVEEK